jgi:cytochrome b561
MTNDNAATRYSAAAQWLHWLVAALIVVQFSLAWSADDLPLGAKKLGLLAWHKSVGMTVLMLAVLRLLWRLTHEPPPLPADMSRLERTLARVSHAVLYALIFIMPITGWMMSSAKNYAVSWFKLFTFPNLVGPNERAFELLRDTHDTLSDVLLVVASLHLAAALKHHFWDKDDVLRRMLPFTRPAGRP